MFETLYVRMYDMLHLIFHFNMTDYPVVVPRSIVITMLYFKHGVLVHWCLTLKKNNQMWSVLVAS